MSSLREDDGFTLLEVIIAFVILSLSLAIATQTISRSITTYTRADLLEQASDVALELASTRLSSINEPGLEQGKLDDGTQWTMASTAIDNGNGSPLLAVTIEVTLDQTLAAPYRFRTFVVP
ncbi:MAG: type II secretion system protein [Pseudomonadota bacterium]